MARLRARPLAWLACLATVAVHADDKASTKPAEDKTVQKVEIQGKADSYDPRRDDTASKIVVGREEILKYGDTSLLDVFKRLPGVTVSGTSVRLRGLGSYTQVLLNGERPPAGFSIDNLPPEQIEKIEIVRAATAEYSTQSIAGTINIILKKSVQKATREARAGLGGGAGSYSPNGGFSLSDKVDTLSYTLGANVYYSKDPGHGSSHQQLFDAAGLPAGGYDNQNDFDNRYVNMGANGRLSWQFADGDSLAWQTFGNGGHGHSDSRALQSPLAGGTIPYDLLFSRFENTYDFARTELNPVLKLGDGAKLDMKFSLSFNEFEGWAHRLGSLATKSTLDRTSDSDSREHNVGSSGKYTRTGENGHALGLGWDIGAGRRHDDSNQTDIVPNAADAISFINQFDADLKRAAFFIQDEWNVTPQWSVYTGARWEGLETRSRGSGFDEFMSRSSVFSPLFQTLYKFKESKGDQLRFALTRTYKAPGLGGLIPRRFYSALNTPANPDYSGNPHLLPELATGIDAGFEHYWGEGALLSASISSRRISQFQGGGVVREGGRYVRMPLNLGGAESHGIELEAKFPLKAIVADAAAVDLRASLSRYWSHLDQVPGPDNRLDRQTPLSLNLGADYRHDALSAGFSFAFRQGGWVRVSETEFDYSDYGRDLELYGLWKFSPQTQLRVTGRNLLKQGSHTQTRYADANGQTLGQNTTERPLGWRLNLEHKF